MIKFLKVPLSTIGEFIKHIFHIHPAYSLSSVILILIWMLNQSSATLKMCCFADNIKKILNHQCSNFHNEIKNDEYA